MKITNERRKPVKLLETDIASMTDEQRSRLIKEVSTGRPSEMKPGVLRLGKGGPTCRSTKKR